MSSPNLIGLLKAARNTSSHKYTPQYTTSKGTKAKAPKVKYGWDRFAPQPYDDPFEPKPIEQVLAEDAANASKHKYTPQDTTSKGGKAKAPKVRYGWDRFAPHTEDYEGYSEPEAPKRFTPQPYDDPFEPKPLNKVAFAPGIPGSLDYGTYARSSGGNYYQSAHKASSVDPNLNGKNAQALKDGASIGSLAFGGIGAIRALAAAPKLVGAARGLWGAARAATGSLAKATGEMANGIANADAVQSVGGTSSTARGISKATGASGRTGVRRGGNVVASAMRNNGNVVGMAGDYAKQLAYKVPYAGAAYKFYNNASTVSGAFGK